MPSYSQRIIGVILLSLGLIFLLANLFDVNVWLVCFPVFLIVAGLWQLIRPSLAINGKPITIRLLGDINRYGSWNVINQEIWVFVGDVKLDFTRAEIPPGQTTIRIYGFVGDVDLLTSEDVGVSISANGFVIDAKLWGIKQEKILSGVHRANSVYNTVERRLNLETYFFVMDLNADQVTEVVSAQ
jgi:predicted membrane protein